MATSCPVINGRSGPRESQRTCTRRPCTEKRLLVAVVWATLAFGAEEWLWAGARSDYDHFFAVLLPRPRTRLRTRSGCPSSLQAQFARSMADYGHMRRALPLCLLLLAPCGRYSGPDDIVGVIQWNHVGGVQDWLEHGGDPNLMIEGKSLAYIACGPKGGAKVLRVLLEAGADPNLGTDGGTTPLMNAASWASLERCRLLVAHGADPSARRDDGRTAISAALACSNSEDVVAYLKFLVAKRAVDSPSAD